VILLAGAWLRFSRLDLLEFQSDEAYAAQLAVDFVRNGNFPLAGLMSSVGVTNPPLFIYLLIPMFMVSSSPVFVSGCIAVLGLLSVLATWHVGRKYYGSVVGLVAAAFFAVSPWAVIYSRKIWAQDFVPVLATGSIWAMHALVLGKNPRAVFWVVMLPLCVAQVHFSGVIMTASVALMILWLRPRMDWRYAVGGLMGALVLLAPYVKFQVDTGWRDFKVAVSQVGGDDAGETRGVPTVHPVTGYRLPGDRPVAHTLAIMNAGQIEDVLGITADPSLDRSGIHSAKPGGQGRYFSEMTGIWGTMLMIQRLACVAAVVWMVSAIVMTVRRTRRFPFVSVAEDGEGRGMWVVVLWLVLPAVLFSVAGMRTYLTYFAILYPAHFLAQAVALVRVTGQKNWPVAGAVTGLFVLANVAYLLAYYDFVGSMGGAQGTHGTGLGYKIEAAHFLVAHEGDAFRRECQAHIGLAMSRDGDERRSLMEVLKHSKLRQLNHEGRIELPQLEWPWLIEEAFRSGAMKGHAAGSEKKAIVIWDRNREALSANAYAQLAAMPQTNFGPIHLVIVNR
jgi:hypothetical protein